MQRGDAPGTVGTPSGLGQARDTHICVPMQAWPDRGRASAREAATQGLEVAQSLSSVTRGQFARRDLGEDGGEQ